jgi:uncharacterized membrane protein YgdD (TMEM256/DUF423 family)
MMPAAKIILILASFLGFLGILLGALGAHALEETLLERGTESAWNTAVLYHLFHAVALLAAGVWLRTEPRRLLTAAAICWLAGTLAFSGSLYWLSLGGPGFLGPITPLGGLILMAGWLLLALAAWRTS